MRSSCRGGESKLRSRWRWRKSRAGIRVDDMDLFGLSVQLVAASMGAAGRSRPSMCLLVPLVHVKHAFNLSDEELLECGSESVKWL